MRIVLERGRGQPLERCDLGVGHRFRAPGQRDQLDDANAVEHPEALGEREAREAVARKQGKGDLLSPVLPATPALVDWQEVLDVTLDELITHHLLVAGSGSQHIPGRHEFRGVKLIGDVITHRVGT